MVGDVTRPASVPGAEASSTLRAPGTAVTEAQLDEHLTRHISTFAKAGSAGQERMALLGLLMAQLTEVDRDLVCRLLGVKEAKLQSLVQGRDAIPASVHARWSLLSAVLTQVRLVLEDSYLQSWLTNPAPDLEGKTPFSCLTGNSRDREAVRRLARRVSDPSFT
jgi:hypothetical protein